MISLAHFCIRHCHLQGHLTVDGNFHRNVDLISSSMEALCVESSKCLYTELNYIDLKRSIHNDQYLIVPTNVIDMSVLTNHVQILLSIWEKLSVSDLLDGYLLEITNNAHSMKQSWNKVFGCSNKAVSWKSTYVFSQMSSQLHAICGNSFVHCSTTHSVLVLHSLRVHAIESCGNDNWRPWNI